MAAKLLYFSKVVLIHRVLESSAIAQMKVWEVGVRKEYQLGIKYSLFCVETRSNEIIIGFDNHHPKSHHKHIGKNETIVNFTNIDDLIDEFWSEIEKRGYKL